MTVLIKKCGAAKCETLASPKHGKIIFTKVLLKLLYVPIKRKTLSTPLFWADLTFEWYEDDMVFCAFIVIIFRTNDKKRYLDANDFRQCYGIFFWKLAFWKLLDHSFVQSPFPAVTKHIDNCILKDNPRFYITVLLLQEHGLTCLQNLLLKLR